MKNINAIVFLSETGHSREYAELLSKEINIPSYDLNNCKDLAKGSSIIYIGWLSAGFLKGYKKANSKYDIQAVCSVGMGAKDTQLPDVIKQNKISDNIPSFYLQGGFEIEKLHGINKFMMNTMKKTVGKALSEKVYSTDDEKAMLDLLINGGNKVLKANLKNIINWYNK